MKYWNELEDSIFFNTIFSYQVPIEKIALHALKIDFLSSRAIITFDIPETPDRPPEKWTRQAFNTCQIGLTCFRVNLLNTQYKHTAEPVTIKITKKTNHYIVNIENAACKIHLEADHIMLNGPAVYLNEIK